MFFVELEAAQEERIRRDGTEFRLTHKASKRDRASSLKVLLALDEAHKLSSTNEFEGAERYLRINNTDLLPSQAAALIRDSFGLGGATIR